MKKPTEVGLLMRMAGADLRLSLLIQLSDWNRYVRRPTAVQGLHLHSGASACAFICIVRTPERFLLLVVCGFRLPQRLFLLDHTEDITQVFYDKDVPHLRALGVG